MPNEEMKSAANRPTCQRVHCVPGVGLWRLMGIVV